MKLIVFEKKHHAGKLINELEQISVLKPIETEEGKQAIFTLKHNEDNIIYLRVPDNVSEAEIQTIIENHDPTPPEPLPDPDEELYNAIEVATNFEELKGALLGQVGKARAKGKSV